MKIRIKGNSIRFRLSRPEVEKFCAEGSLSDATQFADAILVYTLRSTNEEVLSARYSNNEIELRVPELFHKNWNKNEEVGFSGEQQLSNGAMLSLVVEKDFKCLDNADDKEEADNYENPSTSCAP